MLIETRRREKKREVPAAAAQLRPQLVVGVSGGTRLTPHISRHTLGVPKTSEGLLNIIIRKLYRHEMRDARD